MPVLPSFLPFFLSASVVSRKVKLPGDTQASRTLLTHAKAGDTHPLKGDFALSGECTDADIVLFYDEELGVYGERANNQYKCKRGC